MEVIADAFWSHVQVSEDKNACWPWMRARLKKGYGHFYENGKYILAHRRAYLLANGEIDDSLLVLHSCDNPCCCNPAHLSQGTYARNIKEAYARGRMPKTHISTTQGEKHWNAHLTEDDVARIVTLYEGGGLTQQSLADTFGVSRTQIGRIVRAEQWKNVGR